MNVTSFPQLTRVTLAYFNKIIEYGQSFINQVLYTPSRDALPSMYLLVKTGINER